MKVILKEDVRGTGYEGDVVEVKDGFARHKLIPSKLAIKATENNIKILQDQIAEVEKKAKEKRDNATALAEKLGALEVLLEAEAGEKGRLFGAVTNVDIAKKLLEDHDIDIDRRDIVISVPIKVLGDTVVTVKLYKEVSADLKVKIARKGEEISEPQKEEVESAAEPEAGAEIEAEVQAE